MTIVNHSQDFLAITSTWFNDQATSDIQIRLKNDKVVYCHRLVLNSWSKVWAAALEDEKRAALDLTSHDAATVEMCLRYCYTSTIDLTEDNLTIVHLFAHQYNLKALEATCEQMIVQWMNQGLSTANCMGLYRHLLEHKFPGLPNALQCVESFVSKKFASASQSHGFLCLPLEVLCKLLKADDLTATEDDVLDACCRWLAASSVGSDPQVREQVMQLVRFPMLSAKKLLEFKAHPLMLQSDSLKNRHHFALEWVVTNLVSADLDQATLRIKLAEENKIEILTPRAPLYFHSQILDVDMTRTLFSMLGEKYKVARLLIDSSVSKSCQGFDSAVKGKAPFVCIIKGHKGHVFGGYVEDDSLGGCPGGWVPGSPNNFLFSLKNIPPQKVVKLKRSDEGSGIYVSKGYGLNIGGLRAFNSHKTGDSDAFELAPGYESVGEKTLHGKLGDYTPEFMEVFALSKLI